MVGRSVQAAVGAGISVARTACHVPSSLLIKTEKIITNNSLGNDWIITSSSVVLR